MKKDRRSSADNTKPKHMKKRRVALRYTALILTGLLTGLGLYLCNAEVIGRDPMPMPFGTGIAVVTTGSMEPALSVNDLIFVRKSDTYEEGDIAVVRSGNSLVVHRIVSIREAEKDTGTKGEDADTHEMQVILKGDANNAEDAPVPLSSIKGKVVFLIPLMGALLMLIKSGTGIVLLTAAGVLLIEVPFRRKKRENDRALEEIRCEIDRLKEEASQEETVKEADLK